ncbi:glycosyltransferase family 2 protein [Thermococcus sp.]|uniref:glycosyltransferase n=1 Tax=Thermococcus sp. TaxID=35749 RepID=UPI0025D6288B|nr:glycosyltransferase family 2 protein [Thermococcus sp.]
MNFGKKQISVVMCVKNRENEIERALKSVKKQKGVLEIIIVDGNSTDRTIEIARRYADKIYSDKGKGLAFARQLGAEKARGEYIAYIDSDTELPKDDLLIRMIEEMEKHGWVAIHAQLVNPRKNKTLWEYCEDMHLETRFNKPGERKYIGTIVCIVKRDIVLKYHFDPFMKYAAEDTEFWSRVGQEHKFGISRHVAFHYHRASFNDFVKQRIWYGKGNARAIAKHNAWKLLFVPLGIMAYGIFQALRCRKCIKCIPYYLVWGIALLYGTITGLVEVWGER